MVIYGYGLNNYVKDRLDIGPNCNELVTQGLNIALRYIVLGYVCVRARVCLIAPIFKSQKYSLKNSYFNLWNPSRL